jgi:hypothetical protein
MDLISNLALGFGVAFTPINLAYALVGCILGTLIGVLPGIGPVATIAMLLPATYALPPVSALIMLAGIYYGAQYGGSTTAILVNLPGEASSVVTVIDGYQMARKGRAGPALATAGIGSFFAGTVGTLILAAFAPPLTEVAFKFGPAEYFALMVLGLIGAVVLASGSLVKAIGMILLGLLLGLIGTDVNSGVARFSFGVPELTDGIGIVRSLPTWRSPRASARCLPPRSRASCPRCRTSRRSRRRSCAVRPWAQCWASCPVAAPCSLPLPPTRLKRSSVPSPVRCLLARAIFGALRRPSRPTTPAPRPPSSRC